MSKVYGDTVALDDVSLTVRAGEIHGLLGENGAGKSTLVKILAGVVRPDTGTIQVAGHELPHPHDHHDVRAAGMAFIHQDTGLVEEMTVAENVALLNGFPTRGRLIDWAELRRRTRSALDLLALDVDADEPVANLPLATRAGIAIARALAVDASIIVLDEPTASLPSSEADVVFTTLARLRDAGIACVLISHRTAEVLDSCEFVTVLRDGRRVAGRETAGLTPDALTEMIIGYSPEVIEHAVEHGVATSGRAIRLHLSGFRSEVLGPIDLDVAPGAIVGVTGLADGGHLQLAEALFGRAPRSGTCELDGEPFDPRGPREAIDRGIAMVPADRSSDGLALTLTAAENLALNPVGGVLSRVRQRRERARAHELLERYDVRPPDPDRTPDTLSGGNAQKLLLAKWLSRHPSLVLLCEPTTGVDVGAKAAIWNAVGAACADGCAALVLSSDFEEVAAVCSSVLVLRGGLPAGVLNGDFTMADIHRLATGADDPS